MMEVSTYTSRLDSAVSTYYSNRRWVMERRWKESEETGKQLVRKMGGLQKVSAA